MSKDASTLTNTEKTRQRISAQFFSKGAAQELKNRFVSNKFNELKSQIEGFSKKKKKNDKEKQKRKKELKSNVTKFVAVASVVGIVGYLAVKKLEDLYNNFVQPIQFPSVNVKVGEYIEFIEKNYTNNYVKSVKENFQASLGVNENSNNLYNPSYRGVVGGPFGVIIPNFVLHTIWYVFRKLGHGWFLELIDFRKSENHDMIIGMLEVRKKNKISYYAQGNTRDVLDIELGNANVQQRLHNEYLGKLQILEATLGDENWAWDDYSEIKIQTSELNSVLESYVTNENLMTSGFQFKSFVNLEATGKITKEREKTITVQDLYMSPSGVYNTGRTREVTITEKYDTRENIPIKPFADYDFDEHGADEDYVEENRIIKTPKKFAWINDMYDETRKLWRDFGDKEVLQPLKTYREQLYGKSKEADDGEFWNLTRVGYLMQLYAALNQYLTYQQLKSSESMIGFYNEWLPDERTKQFGQMLIDQMKKNSERPDAWEVEYAKGQISYEDYYARAIADLRKVVGFNDGKIDIEKKFLSELRRVVSKKIHLAQEKLKNLTIKDVITQLKTNIKQVLLGRNGNAGRLVTLNRQTLKEALKPNQAEMQSSRNFYKDNKGYNIIPGWGKKVKLFNKTYVNNSKEAIFSTSDAVVQHLGYKNKFFHHVLWKKEFWGQAPELSPSNAWGTVDEAYYPGTVYKSPHYYHKGDGLWGFARSPQAYNEYAPIINWGKGNNDAWNNNNGWDKKDVYDYWYYGDRPSAKDIAQGWFFISIEGYKYTNAYEYIDDQGNIGLVYLDEYYYSWGKPSSWRSITLSKEKYKDGFVLENGSYSDAAKFKDQFIDNKEYGFTTRQSIQVILDAVDEVEIDKKRLMKERCEIIKEMMKKGGIVGGDGNLIEGRNTLHLIRIS